MEKATERTSFTQAQDKLAAPTSRLALSPTPQLAKAIEKGQILLDSYPSGISSLVPSIHDVQYYQGILRNTSNFAATTKCDIFEVGENFGDWKRDVEEKILLDYLKAHVDEHHKVSLRVIFCTLKKAPGTTFGHQLSISQAGTQQMLEEFNISPQFVPLLLAEPDYWSPGDFTSYSTIGEFEQLEYFCQQPRWNIHQQQTPWCIYMNHSASVSTTYIVVSGEQYLPNETIKERLTALFSGSSEALASRSHTRDPFLLHCMITHEALVEAKGVITSLRRRLYDQLDKVDLYAKNALKREHLEELTIELHGISQNTDSLIASADMAEMIATTMASAHSRFVDILGHKDVKDKTMKVSDSLRYLQSSIQSQRRWLLSYKARKDIAMNLVFNLVTQQDSATTTLIARETRRDGSSMKTIAALTMLFLPGTFMSSVFSLDFIRGIPWWVYVAITLLLTLMVILLWWFWTSFPVTTWTKHLIMRWRRKKQSVGHNEV